MIGLVGRKVGMTQLLSPAGHFWPVTLIKFEKAVIKEHKTEEKHGYTAVQIATEDIREKLINKAKVGQFKAAKIPNKRFIREYRVGAEALAEYEVGKEIDVTFFEEGDFVDVRSKTIGRGFAGTIKRWGMSRGPETHGSMSHRRIGSIGMASTPSRVLKGQRMPGRYGNENTCVQNLLVVKVDPENQVIAVRGSFAGHDETVVSVTKSFKRAKVDIEEAYKIAAAGPQKKSKTAQKK